jgi:hypothetical protein
MMEGLREAVVSTLKSARQDLADRQKRCMIAAIFFGVSSVLAGLEESKST